MKYRNAFLQLLSVLTLCLVGWAINKAIQQPTIGVFWGPSSGEIYEVEGSHPAAKFFQVGDRIIQGDGLAPAQLYQLSGKNPGDVVQLEINRDGKDQTFMVPVTKSDFQLVVERLIPITIALFFWIVGILVLAFSRSGVSPLLYFLACQSAAVSLSSGTVSSFSPEWTKVLLHIGLIWTGAFTMNLHLVFPARIFNRITRFVAFIGIGVAAVLSLIFVVGFFIDERFISGNQIWWITLFFLGTALVASIILLIRAHQKALNAKEHHQAGIIILSGIIGILPTVIFTIIPTLIEGSPIIPPHYGFLSLVAIPFGYGYAILRYRLIGVDKTINRGTAYAFVMLFLGGVYAVFYSLTAKYLPPFISYSHVWIFGFAILYAILINRLFRISFNFVNHILYGGWYDYRSVVGNVSLSLETVPSKDYEIGSVLCQTIGMSMRLDTVRLVLRDGSTFSFEDDNSFQSNHLETVRLNKLFNSISDSKPTNIFLPFNDRFDGLELGNLALRDVKPEYLIPLRGKSKNLIGVFIIGKKKDGEGLYETDLDILRVVVLQAQVTLENALLLSQAQKHSEKISKLNRKVIRGREEERKSVARDLHDSVIQSLVGMNYRLSQMRVNLCAIEDTSIVAVQDQTRSLIVELRNICYNLRPPSLDALGFYAAIRAKAAEIEEAAQIKIRVNIDANENQEISEEVMHCVYRFVQESLINVQKHAEADHVEVWIQVTSEKVTVSITDNGVGFVVPESLEEFRETKHYGLLGLQELIEAVSGEVQVVSAPGSGCELLAEVPL
jgi:signal transduction histidine kinase